MADHLGFKVQRLKVDQCRLLMPNVVVNDTLTEIELTDTLTNIEALLREAAEEKLFARGQEMLARSRKAGLAGRRAGL